MYALHTATVSLRDLWAVTPTRNRRPDSSVKSKHATPKLVHPLVPTPHGTHDTLPRGRGNSVWSSLTERLFTQDGNSGAL